MSRLLRRARSGDESGFALIFVLFVSTMVMIGTATMLSVVSTNIGPAKTSQDDYAALAAARSGIQDYLAQLNANCRSLSIEKCRDLPAKIGPTTIGNQTYTVTAQNTDAYVADNDNTLRIVSLGQAASRKKTLTADLSNTPSVLRYTYFSNYETLGTKFLDDYYPERTITLNDSAVAAAIGLPLNSTVHWNGAGAAPRNGYSDTVCDALYYADPSNPAAVATGRAGAAATRTALAPGTDFSESGYTRSATAGVVLPTTTSVDVSRDARCEAQFSKGMTFSGPVYSQDALYISNGEVGSTSGPAFTVPSGEGLPPASTAWTATRTPAAPAAPYRTDAQLGGKPATTGSGAAVVSAPSTLTLPSSAAPSSDCTYSGPTRVVLSGSTATISSPLTPGNATNPCYRSTGAGSGVVSAKVSVGSTVIRVDNSATAISGATAPSFPGLTLGAGGDVTAYSTKLGDAYVEGALTAGKLSLVTAHDIVVTGDLTTTKTTDVNAAGEPRWRSGAAVDLVATNNVRVYHPVKCKTDTATNGYCPNDITGLYSNAETKLVATTDGTLKTTHPSKQYVNLAAASSRTIDAAVLALTGSVMSDNFNRGDALGMLTVNGGVYMNHRGGLGQLWEVPTSTIGGSRPSSGYLLRLNYLDYSKATLPYVPVLDDAGNPATPWKIYNVSTGGTP